MKINWIKKAEAPTTTLVPEDQLSRVQLEQDDANHLDTYPFQCGDCIWYRGDATCDAFPKGIPTTILLDAYDHNQHYEDGTQDDGGLVHTTWADIEPTLQAIQKAEQGPLPGFGHVFKSNPYRDAAGQYTTPEKAVRGAAHALTGGWQKTGSKLGSNAGGVYMKDGVKHYVKFPNEKGQIYAEAASDQMHELLGVKTLNHQPTDVNGRIASVTKWQDVEPLGHAGWRDMSEKHVKQAADLFMASALTKNWDVVGAVYDNVGKDAKGDLRILDTGGSFKYRAQGGPKSYDKDPTPEIDNMLSPDKTSGRVFGPLLAEHPKAFREAAERLSKVSDDDIRRIAGTMRDKTMGDTAVARKNAIVKRFTQD